MTSESRKRLGGDVEADPVGDDGLAAEALDEVEDDLRGHDLDSGPRGDVGGGGPARSFGGDLRDRRPGGGFVDDRLLGGVSGDEGLQRQIVDRPGQAAAHLVNEGGGGEQALPPMSPAETTSYIAQHLALAAPSTADLPLIGIEAIREVSVGPSDAAIDLKQQAGRERSGFEGCRLGSQTAAAQEVAACIDHAEQTLADPPFLAGRRALADAHQLGSQLSQLAAITGGSSNSNAARVVPKRRTGGSRGRDHHPISSIGGTQPVTFDRP